MANDYSVIGKIKNIRNNLVNLSQEDFYTKYNQIKIFSFCPKNIIKDNDKENYINLNTNINNFSKSNLQSEMINNESELIDLTNFNNINYIQQLMPQEEIETRPFKKVTFHRKKLKPNMAYSVTSEEESKFNSNTCNFSFNIYRHQ